jgi:signal transduction histidine kinase
MSAINKQLQQALSEQQKVSQMLIQKDLELAKTNDQLDRQVDQLKVLQEMVSHVRTISSQGKALDIIARGLVLDLHFSAAIILLGLPPFKLGVKYSYKPIEIEKLRWHSLIKKAYTVNTQIFVQDINKTNLEEKQLGDILHLTSFYVSSLQVRTKRYGLFICGLENPYQKLTALDIEFLEIVANSVAITLGNLEAEERQRTIDRLKSEFVAIASHQLRTPLSVIKWTLKMCLDGDLGNLNKEQREFLEKTYKSNEQMIDLVNDLLDVSRIEEGKLEYKFVRFDITELLKEVLDQYKPVINKKNLKLETNTGETGKIIVKGDREKLFLAFNNLVDNAIKFTLKGGSIGILVKKQARKVQVTVKDTGMGMNRQDQEQIFTKFFRSEQAKRTQTYGTGLGLFIVKNIIEGHRGRIKVKSQEGKGTSVVCWLPKG